MNKRQKKKWIKKNLIHIKKIRPSERDIVFFIPDFDRVDVDMVVEFYKSCVKAGIFDRCGCALIPGNIKKMDVDTAQSFIDGIQEVINRTRKKNQTNYIIKGEIDD